jgi:hypothetical protein
MKLLFRLYEGLVLFICTFYNDMFRPYNGHHQVYLRGLEKYTFQVRAGSLFWVDSIQFLYEPRAVTHLFHSKIRDNI